MPILLTKMFNFVAKIELLKIKPIKKESDDIINLLWYRVQMGEKAAFEELYNTTIEPLRVITFAFVKDEELTKDILQEIYISLYQKRQQLPSKLNVRGYLRNAVKYRIANHVRNQMVRQKYALEIVHNTTHAVVASIPAEEKEIAGFIGEGISNLPEKCREAFILKEYQQLSNADIADAMGISVKTAEKHISRALRLLREKLSRIAVNLWTVMVIVNCDYTYARASLLNFQLPDFVFVY